LLLIDLKKGLRLVGKKGGRAKYSPKKKKAAAKGGNGGVGGGGGGEGEGCSSYRRRERGHCFFKKKREGGIAGNCCKESWPSSTSFGENRTRRHSYLGTCHAEKKPVGVPYEEKKTFPRKSAQPGCGQEV